MSNANGKIWLGDKLPSIYDASLHIKFLSPTRNANRSSIVYQYSLALFELWGKSFTTSHVASFSTVLRTVERVIIAYDKFIKRNWRNGLKSSRQIN